MSDQRDRTAYFREYGKMWYKTVVKPRKIAWFQENGPCVDCGSWEHLELDHEDPSTKIHHVVWTWERVRRLNELAKCKVRCHLCHAKKTHRENLKRDIWKTRRKPVIEGKLWCKGHQDFVPVENFSHDKHSNNGYYSQCRECRRKLPSRKSKKLGM